MSTITYIDIETGPASPDALRAVEPEFTAAANIKDPEKIAASIEAKRAAWLEDAALSAITGQVLAVGMLLPSGEERIIHQSVDRTEEAVIAETLTTIRDLRMGAAGVMAGWNIHAFDLPFIVRRAWVYGLPLPGGLSPSGTGDYFKWPPYLLDLRNIWALGERQASGSLGQVAKLLHVGEKSGHGRDFARLFNGTPDERKQALAYLAGDLALTRAIGERLLGSSFLATAPVW